MARQQSRCRAGLLGCAGSLAVDGRWLRTSYIQPNRFTDCLSVGPSNRLGTHTPLPIIIARKYGHCRYDGETPAETGHKG